jgi:hypothetical protein
MTRRAEPREIPFDDFYAGVPVIATWHECRDTDDGWRAVTEDGRAVHVVCRGRDDGRVARLPERNKIAVFDGTTVAGIIVLERATG